MNNDILSRYEQAQALMQGMISNRVVKNDTLFPNWIPNSEYFWYRRDTKSGNKEFRLVDAKSASNNSAFDHQALANSLTQATGKPVDSLNLPFKDIEITLSPPQIRFQFLDKDWLFDQENALCQEQSIAPPEQGISSPDGKKMVYVHESNLWIRDRATGEERALTDDGSPDFQYGRTLLDLDPKLQVLWSPDSSQIFAVQLDIRKVKTRNIVHFAPPDGSLHQKTTPIRLSHSGDQCIESYRLVSINVATGQVKAADYAHLPYSNYSLVYGFFSAGLGWWSLDNQHAFFVDVTRGSKAVRVVRWDTHTGATRVLFEENTATFINLCSDAFDLPLFMPLPESNELVWFSERSDWAHLYLYDLNTGELKHPITGGKSSTNGEKWMVRDILHYDPTQRELLLKTAGRDANISPYYVDICKVNIDSGELTPIVFGDFEHLVHREKNYLVSIIEFLAIGRKEKISGVSPCGKYIVTTASRVDTAPVTKLVDRNGNNILTLETTDISCLPAGWQWPEPVKLKAADDKTDIYGVVFRPPHFSPDKRYPVIDFLIGCRQLNFSPQGSFNNDPICTYLEMSALAALGFIVVGIGGRGTALRNKSFHDHQFGKLGAEDDLNDHIAGIRQLAQRYPSMDLEHVGCTHMEGLASGVYSLLKHSGFYKVCVCHVLGDARFDTGMNEKYSGIIDKETLAKAQGPEDFVDSFSGKLLLIHGSMQDAEPLFRLVEALQKANKDFDMLCLPNLMSEVTSYTRRRAWDYLVRHLQGIEPPRQFRLVAGELLLEEANLTTTAAERAEKIMAKHPIQEPC
ncbi:S9 family peptidase [Porticoccaceae bacterium]|nr:S9 family peptidase [Porticoccaceae bacterium]